MSHRFPIFFLTSLLGISVVTQTVLSQDYGLRETSDEAGLTVSAPLTTVVGNALGTILAMAGVIFFGLMVYGGILWMIDRGNEEQSKKALETIRAAIIGVVIILASYAITNLVFNSTSSAGEEQKTDAGGGTPTTDGGFVGPPAPPTYWCFDVPSRTCNTCAESQYTDPAACAMEAYNITDGACIEKPDNFCRDFGQVECTQGVRAERCMWNAGNSQCVFIGNCTLQPNLGRCEVSDYTSGGSSYIYGDYCTWSPTVHTDNAG